MPGEGGIEGALRCLGLSRPLPRLPIPSSSRSCSSSDSLGWGGGGGGRYEGPTPTTHNLILATPITPPSPPEALSEGVLRVGAGAWGVEPSLPRTLPNTCEVVPPPSDVRADGSTGLHLCWAGFRGRDGYNWQARGSCLGLCCPTPLPPDPPPHLPHDPAPDFRTSLSQDMRKSGAGSRRRGEGLGAHPSGGLGKAGFWPPLPRSRREERVKTLFLKWVPNFGWSG